MTFEELATAFFTDYVVLSPQAIGRNGYINLEGMREAAMLLLKEGIFDSPQEMRKEACMEYGIILPELIFERKWRNEY